MRVLAFETTADDTGAALIEKQGSYFKVLANTVISQTKIHQRFGGIMPMQAGRAHLENIDKALRDTLRLMGAQNQDQQRRYMADKIELIAVAHAPGLIPCLLVGSSFARTLSWRFEKKFVGVHHLEGHIFSSFLNNDIKKLEFPALALIVSGGHTQLVEMKKMGHFVVLGKTRDDAVGEAFDKVGKMLGFSYPSGPAVEKAAKKSKSTSLKFTAPMLKSENLDFSFAGLKTAVLYKKQNLEKETLLSNASRYELAFAFQEAAFESLIRKTVKACRLIKPKSFLLGGGVSANQVLRKKLKKALEKLPHAPGLFFPDTAYAGDNAAMIGLAGILRFQAGLVGTWRDFPARAKLPLKSWRLENSSGKLEKSNRN